MKDSEVLARVYALLESETTAVLATRESDPVATPLFFVADGLELYWLSSTDSRHSRNLAHHPKCSVSVHVAVTDWRDIRGLQMDGDGYVAAEREPAIARYRARFRLGPEFDSVIEASTLYVFRPRWLRYLDNSLGFGFKREIFL
jgi:uncharacterized protein YhbP (UPF0306 family)